MKAIFAFGYPSYYDTFRGKKWELGIKLTFDGRRMFLNVGTGITSQVSISILGSVRYFSEKYSKKSLVSTLISQERKDQCLDNRSLRLDTVYTTLYYKLQTDTIQFLCVILIISLVILLFCFSIPIIRKSPDYSVITCIFTL